MRRATRAATAGLTALASLGALLALAEPASAGCAARDIDEVLAEGFTIAIVTRTDGGGPVATLRVEASAGPKPPGTLTAPMETTGECRSFVGHGKVAAVVLYRENGGWALGGTSFELGPAFFRAQGAPVAAKGGTIVAYAAGNFGGARVAGLDKDGRAVAWGGGHGYGERVATCPGGSTVVVLGRPPKTYTGRSAQLTVHDAATLRVRRTVRVQFGGYGSPGALHCRDADAGKVDILIDVRLGPPGRELEERGRLLTVDGTKVRHRDLPPVQSAAATSDGFVAAVGDASEATSLVRIRPGGKRLLNPTGYRILGYAAGALAVSPDERTVALSVHARRTSGTSIVTVDLGTGERLGSATPRGQFLTGLAWVGPKRLLVRDTPFQRLPMRVLDREARPIGTWPRAGIPNNQSSTLSALGGDALVYGAGRRVTVIPRSGDPRVAGSLRLAAAAHVVGVPGGRFAGGKPAS